jgi:hypothetical protein
MYLVLSAGCIHAAIFMAVHLVLLSSSRTDLRALMNSGRVAGCTSEKNQSAVVRNILAETVNVLFYQ